MAKANVKEAAIQEALTSGLVRVATTDGFMRLTGKGEYPPVFGKGAHEKQAAKLAIDESNPLLKEIGSTKAANAYVQLTPAGLIHITKVLPEESIGVAAKKVAEALPAVQQVEFLQEILPSTPAAAPELESLLAAAVQQQTAESEARVAAERARAERADKAQAALRRCFEHLEKLKSDRVDELKRLLIAAGGTVPEREVPVPHVPAQEQAGRPHTAPSRTPETDEDREFRQDVAERLVSSWRDAVIMKKDEARRFLETALDNISGIRRIGEEGEEVPFDGAYHEHVDGVFTNQTVKITQSGWALENGDDREYVIQKASITK